MHRRRRRRALPPMRGRRGSALFLTLVVTMALAGLAVSAIYLSSSASVLSKYYDRERDYKYAAEWALNVGMGRLGLDTSLVLPDSGYVTLLSAANVTNASGGSVPRVKVDLYAGLSGNTTGQYGQYVSLVAVSSDNAGARHVRRVELEAENFARYAVFTDSWQSGLCYATGELIRGRAHSNGDWVSCGPPGPDYKDTVSAVGNVTGSAIYERGNVPQARAIPYPTVAKLAALPTMAAAANLSITAKAASAGGTRIQFVTVDLDGDGDTTDPDEGFIMVFDGDVTNDTTRTRAGMADANPTSPTPSTDPVMLKQCGDFHTFGGGSHAHQVFVPVNVHNQTWVRDSLVGSGMGTTAANAVIAEAWYTVLQHPGARCYPAGDPHLVATERSGAPKKGGDDTTFTATTLTGHWRAWPGTVNARVTAAAGAMAPYLWPLHRSLNAASKGVIYVNGSVYVSGELRGRVTLYASQDVKLIDDLVYTTDPSVLPICQNLLGIIAGWDVWVSDNAINRPRMLNNTSTVVFLDDDQDFNLDAVTLSLGSGGLGSFRVEDYSGGPNAGRTCAAGASPTSTSGGCINQVGGFIVKKISATFAGAGTGFAENRQVDACMLVDSPPYFPLTGKYRTNRYYEIDPARFNVANLYRQLQGGM